MLPRHAIIISYAQTSDTSDAITYRRQTRGDAGADKAPNFEGNIAAFLGKWLVETWPCRENEMTKYTQQNDQQEFLRLMGIGYV